MMRLPEKGERLDEFGLKVCRTCGVEKRVLIINTLHLLEVMNIEVIKA